MDSTKKETVKSKSKPKDPYNGKYPICLFQKYWFNIPLPTPRVRDGKKNWPVHLAKAPVLASSSKSEDGGWNIGIVFKDYESKKYYRKLAKKMYTFYGKREGSALAKPHISLRPGEIVAATVLDYNYKEREKMQTIRRVKIKALGDSFVAEDIDSMAQCRIRCAFSLIEEFYYHPAQACTIKVLNFEELHPSDTFEVFFEQWEDFHKVMLQLTCDVLTTIINNRLVIVSKIRMDEEGKLTGNLLISEAEWYRTLYIEQFCKYFTVKLPKMKTPEYGEVTNVEMNGDISICPESSLFPMIDKIINADNIVERYILSRTEDYRNDLFRKVLTLSWFLAFDKPNGERLYRLKILAVKSNPLEIKGLYVDKAKTEWITIENLVCPMTEDPSIPAFLSSIPPQTIKFRLSGVGDFMTPPECQAIMGKHVCFKVVSRSFSPEKFPEVELEHILT